MLSRCNLGSYLAVNVASAVYQAFQNVIIAGDYVAALHTRINPNQPQCVSKCMFVDVCRGCYWQLIPNRLSFITHQVFRRVHTEHGVKERRNLSSVGRNESWWKLLWGRMTIKSTVKIENIYNEKFVLFQPIIHRSFVLSSNIKSSVPALLFTCTQSL